MAQKGSATGCIAIMFGKWQLAEVTRKYHTTCHQKVIVSYSMICQAANLKLENIELCTKDLNLLTGILTSQIKVKKFPVFQI